jgi:hypothetical protein
MLGTHMLWCFEFSFLAALCTILSSLPESIQHTHSSGALKLDRICASSWVSNGKCQSFYENPRCGAQNNANAPLIPEAHFAGTEVCVDSPDTCTPVAGGAGIADADQVRCIALSLSLSLCGWLMYVVVFCTHSLGPGDVCYRHRYVIVQVSDGL